MDPVGPWTSDIWIQYSVQNQYLSIPSYKVDGCTELSRRSRRYFSVFECTL